MNSNNEFHQTDCGCQQCGNGIFNCTDTFRAIDAACIPPSIPEPSKVSYGSFYDPSSNFISVTPVTSPSLGQKVIFTTPGPSLNVDPAPVPNNTTDLQVATNGVYEISANISVFLQNSTAVVGATFVTFGLFINDTNIAIGSQFESEFELGSDDATVFGDENNTIGKTILLRLKKDDRLSIRVIEASQNVFYRFPSLVVTKIAD